jgi:L-lactate dehydrogenase complex protein LldG
MSGSRKEILRALRAVKPPPSPLPEVAELGIRYADVRAQFAKSVAEVAGRCVFVQNRAALNDELERLPELAAAQKIVSLLPGIRRANVDLASIAEGKQLNDVDVCVLPGELGVAENGAVWVRERGTPHRAVWFLAQHVVLVLPAAAIVSNMHEAYQRIDLGGRGFGIFISGPSKTADIEQALVIGAQGPRSCTVLLVE